jgi:hypothetical protein
VPAPLSALPALAASGLGSAASGLSGGGAPSPATTVAQACGAAALASALPKAAAPTLLTSLPAPITAALIPAAAAPASSAASPAVLCATLAGIVGGLNPSGASGGDAPAAGTATGGIQAEAATAVKGASTGAAGSLAFTGAQVWLTALVGLALAMLGGGLLKARRRFA